jgi:hypothetical protein
MNRKLLFLGIGIVYIILLSYGLSVVYSIGNPVPASASKDMKPENKIAIAHTEIFGTLERAQVIFDHKKHEEAAKGEGCKTCHPADEKGKLLFSFPKKVEKSGKKAIMNAYHDACIDCHKKQGAERKKTGPVVCADCHKDAFRNANMKYPVVEFDFAYHDNHVKKLKEKLGKDDCGQCHHIYNPEEKDESKRLTYKEGSEESCYYCHDLGKKRGPELSAIIKVAAKKGLTIRKASHQQCLNCHLKYQDEYRKKGDMDACPTECAKCHTGKYKTVAEIEKVARPNRKQKDTVFISVDNARMKGVTFDHKTHQMASTTCRSCHHETLKGCKECHSLTGKPEGNGINIANAYHRVFSEHSCTGCHNQKKADKNCAGCHQFIAAMDIETMNSPKESCTACHSGKRDQVAMPKALSAAGLDQQKVKKEVEIKVLEKEYEPSKFPHREVIDKLVKISNESKMATYFHGNIKTLCSGCHHRSVADAEAQKDTPPNCRNCHMTAYDREHLNKTKLLSAYHRQCMGCHDAMKLKKGNSMQFAEGSRCDSCHKRKTTGAPAEITQSKNDHVVKQNQTNMLNAWKPK